MSDAKTKRLGFYIDKLTNSVENVVTGDQFATAVAVLDHLDLKTITKAGGWLFDWRKEYQDPIRDVFKLTIVGNPKVIQGLVSVEVRMDHVYMHLLESAPFNRGKNKMYLGVPGNLVAFACKLSFQRGHQGNVAFLAKTRLIAHYEESLGAFHFKGGHMIIDTPVALRLINKYFKGE